MDTTLTHLKKLFPASCHGRIFLVGGCVRDHLLARLHMDIDLVAALTVGELVTCGFRLVEGKSTTPIWFRHEQEFGIIEVTQLTDSGALHQDLERRDFTINAMAMDLEGGLHDPLGGRSDLSHGTLRACSRHSFESDPLRIFRAFRFEADGWLMNRESEALIRKRDWSDSLEQIPVERFSRELLKACSAPEPERFFLRMHEFAVGHCYLPELFSMPAIPAGPLEHHPEGDLLTHSIQVLQRIAQRTDDPLSRFCAFFHDLGKLASDPNCYPRHHGHDEAGFDLARAFCHRLRLPASYRTALSWVSRLHGILNRWSELRDTTRLRTAEQALKAGISTILPLVSAADKVDSGELSGWLRAVEVVRMTTAELGIDQQRLEGMPPQFRSDFILQKKVEKFRTICIAQHGGNT
ncbi:MAG: HD domain-containing protein [Desulfuromonadales bacterium]|nr:HD domain-containing protein [Desulfuromonadales bacterium]